VTTPPRRAGDRRFLAILAGALAIPLLAGLVALRRPTWAPVLDMAMTELRVRDVGTAETPLIGLPGRIFGAGGVQGSHPGPLSFWVLAPVYRLFGSSGFALHVATAVIDLLAIVAALWLGLRLGGRRAAMGVALAIAALFVALGLGSVLEPWNPYLPILWWLVFLLALWGVASGDGPSAIALVASGSLCAQTHVPYLGLCVALGGLGAVALLLFARRDADRRAATLRWAIAALALGVVLWLPPTIDQLTAEPGNYGLLLDHLGSPPDEPVGLGTAWQEGLQRFDLVHLLVDPEVNPGLLTRGRVEEFPLAWRGGALLLAWAGLAAASWRRAPVELRRFHAVVAAATVVGIASVSRIFGVVWFYLLLWLWVVALAALAAAVASALALWRGADRRPSLAAVPAILLAALVLRSVVAAPDAEPSDDRLSLVLEALLDDTEAGLERGDGSAAGRDGRYVVGFSDALHIGSQAYGLVNELERRGFDAYMEPYRAVPITEHRTIAAAEATARVQLVTGHYLDLWREVAGAVEVASVDLRTEAEQREQAALRREVEAELRDEGLSELIPTLDDNLFLAAIDGRASRGLRVKMDRLLRLGGPTSVFVAPPDATLLPEP
jgi:hypothetical protein